MASERTWADEALDEMFGAGSAEAAAAELEAESRVAPEDQATSRKYAVSTADRNRIRRADIDALLGLDMDRVAIGVYVILVTGVPPETSDAEVIDRLRELPESYTTIRYAYGDILGRLERIAQRQAEIEARDWREMPPI